MVDHTPPTSPHDTPEEQPVAAKPRRRGCLSVLLLLIGIALLAMVGFGLFIDIYGQTDQARAAQAIIVLGARVGPDGLPADSLRARTLHAVELYKRGFAPVILCTGGVGDYPPSEAEAASALARTQGVLDGDLLQENTSTSTWENAVNAAKMCRQHGWRRVIVVSDPYHLWRARRDFAQAGLTVYPSPARNCIRNRNLRMRIQWTAREVLAVARDIVVRR